MLTLNGTSVAPVSSSMYAIYHPPNGGPVPESNLNETS